MKLRKMAILLPLMAGCGLAPDPAKSRLPVGSEAVIVGDERNATILAPPGVGKDEVFLGATVGSRVVILDDADDENPGNGFRYTRVSVKEGEYQGPARIGRESLRPIPR